MDSTCILGDKLCPSGQTDHRPEHKCFSTRKAPSLDTKEPESSWVPAGSSAAATKRVRRDGLGFEKLRGFGGRIISRCLVFLQQDLSTTSYCQDCQPRPAPAQKSDHADQYCFSLIYGTQCRACQTKGSAHRKSRIPNKRRTYSAARDNPHLLCPRAWY